MKKFLITLLILIALGSAAFFFGWANFEVPPGSYGVISSKTHGVDPLVVEAGQFRWIWYKLIPTNVTISVYKLDQKPYTIDMKGSLPSADTYVQFLGLNNIDFSWELKGNLSFAISPHSLIDITEKHNITNQDELDGYMQNTADLISQVILTSMAHSTPEEVEALLTGNFFPHDLFKNDFPEISTYTFTVNTAKYPDFALYTEIRKIYEEFLAEQRAYITSSFGQRAVSNIQTQLHFTELERYGELLTKYPILLDYLALKEGN